MMNYTYHSKAILRTPLKPFKMSFTEEELKSIFGGKEVQEALFLSSPNLLNEFTKWQKGELVNKEEEKRLVSSLLKYALRMHTRCTPFGLFAGCDIVNIDNNIVIETKKSKRNTRLDMNFSCALAQELSKISFIQKHLKFYPNTSIYDLQDKIRYVEYYYKDKRRVYQISAVDSSIFLQTIIQKAKDGATIHELATSIVDDEIIIEDALGFVTEIIAAQLLISELEPSATGNELLTQILDVLSSIREKEFDLELVNVIDILKSTQYQLIQIDKKIGNNISIYEGLAEDLKQLNIPFELGKLFQTDLYLNTRKEPLAVSGHTPSVEIKKSLNKALTILNQLTSNPIKTNLSEFKRKFYERYEEKEVALLDVLDIETGIGYAFNTNHTGDVNPLINNIIIPYNPNHDSELLWNKKQSFLLKKLLKSKENKDYSVTLNNEELKEFNENWDDLPESFSIMYKHLGKREEKDLLLLDNVGGASAINLLGRFASSNQEISGLVNEIADTEQKNNPDVIFAEIAHLPESRTGNILLRPAFRKYEILYLSSSTLPKEQQISLEDLFISVRNNQLILRSKKLNKRIIPRLGNAHNYSFNALPVYHFLCDMQTQDIRGGLFFDWGDLASEFYFLPRVEIGNVIVFPATWQLEKEQFQDLLERDINIIEEVKMWQKKWSMPYLILLADGDNELLINLKDELNLMMFISIIKKRLRIVLKEFLFDEKSAIVKDEKGNIYTNEFIAILQKQVKPSLGIRQYELNKMQTVDKIGSSYSITKQKIPRSFSLGSEWLYYKIYCGVKTGDVILTELIKPLTEQLIDEKLIDSWFFIRYSDPDVHLRVRFHFNDLKHVGKVISLFQDAIAGYEKNGLVWKVQTDTYKREIERYGINTMIDSEQIFYYDSKCIINFLDMIDGDDGEEIRWLFAIRMIDNLLLDFNYTQEQKRDLLESLKIGFAKEFNMNKDLKMQLDKKFRTNRKNINDVLNRKKDKASELQPLFVLLNQKSNSIKPIVTQILNLCQNNKLSFSLDDLLASYIHMLLNRLFKNKQRLHEMVIYDFMWRTYRSELAKLEQLKKQMVN